MIYFGVDGQHKQLLEVFGAYLVPSLQDFAVIA